MLQGLTAVAERSGATAEVVDVFEKHRWYLRPRVQSQHLLEEHWVPIASCEDYSNKKARFLNRAPCEAVFQAVTGAGSTPSWASIVIWSK
jgi:hypothetical protein